tara:strand:+ start:756 stop:1055 length:300 start_codon:yes stop_codon:yes gene_type:complete
MIIYVDIDETICYYENERLYHLAKPNKERITKINNLFEQGHNIIYWTARGTLTNINYFSLTHEQLNNWGCKFSELRMGKPAYDLFIDDKNINSEDYFKK